MVKEIKLSQGKVALVDNEDYEWLNQYKWFCSHKYACRRNKITNLPMHREIMKTPKGMYTDHINHNTLDNRKENLRVCTCAENNHNAVAKKHNTSGYKGVYWNKRDKKWYVQIRVSYKRIWLGYFDFIEDAANSYANAAQKYYGKFAYVNHNKETN